MADFGEIFLQIDGENIPVKGNVTFSGLNLGERTFEANMDGSLHGRFTPTPAVAEIDSISGCAIPVSELIALARQCPTDGDGNGMSAIFGLSGGCSSDDVQTIQFVNARVGGNLSLDGSSGEISGFTIASSDVFINGQAVRGGES